MSKSIAEIDVNIGYIARTGATLCEVSVRMSNHVQILARERDLDASKAILRALERARLQASQSLQRARQRRKAGLVAAGP